MNDSRYPPLESAGGHMADLLPAYINYTLEKARREEVELHLAGCASCRSELASWRAISAGSQVALAPATNTQPDPALLDRVWAEIDQARFASQDGAPRWGKRSARSAHVAQLAAGQLRLIPRGIWLASALAVLFGLFVAVVFKDGGQLLPGLLGILVPLVSAVSIAFIYNQEQDPAIELALSTPTSSRLVLASRLAIVGGYNFTLASTVTALLVMGGYGDFSLLASIWLGPMLLLTGLSLFLSLIVGTVAGLASTALLVGLHLINNGSALAGHLDSLTSIEGIWQTSPVILLLAAILFLGALMYVPRQTRLA